MSLHDESKRLFAAALALPADERGLFLAEACEGDPALLAEVTSLLRHHDALELTPGQAGELGGLRRTLGSVIRSWVGPDRAGGEATVPLPSAGEPPPGESMGESLDR